MFTLIYAIKTGIVTFSLKNMVKSILFQPKKQKKMIAISFFVAELFIFKVGHLAIFYIIIYIQVDVPQKPQKSTPYLYSLENKKISKLMYIFIELSKMSSS